MSTVLASNHVHCLNYRDYLLLFLLFFFADLFFAFFFAAMINPLLVKLNDTESKYHVHLYTSQMKTVQTFFHGAIDMIARCSKQIHLRFIRLIA